MHKIRHFVIPSPNRFIAGQAGLYPTLYVIFCVKRVACTV